MWAFLTKGVQGYITVMRAARIASLTNPWAALATVLTVVGVAIYGVVKAWGAHKRALQEQDPAWRAAKAHAKDMAEINKRMNSETANQIATINRLTNIIRSNSYSIGERKSAIEKLQQIVPGYHANIKNEGKLIESNTKKLTDYITELKKAARAQAYMDKLAEIENQLLDADLKLSKKRNNLKAVDAELQRGERMGDKNPYKSNKQTFDLSSDQGRGEASVEVETNSRLLKKLEERKKQEEAINTAEKDRNVILKERSLIYNQMMKDGISIAAEQSTITPLPEPPVTPTTNFVSDEERKKREAEANKAETERKKKLKEQADAAKASYNEQLAEEMLAYRQGVTTYSDYLEEKHNITQNYYNRLKSIYGEDSVEYRTQLLNREKDDEDYIKRQNKMSEQGFRMDKLMRDLELQKQFNDQNNKEMFQNEEALNEALFKSDRQYMLDKQSLYKDGSREWEEAATEIKIMEEEHRLQLEQEWMRRLSQYREEAGQMDYDRLQQIETAGVESFYGALRSQGRMTQEEYDAIIEHIKRKYAELKAQQIGNNDIQTKAASGLETAKKNAGVKSIGAGDDAATGVFSISAAIENQKTVNEQLKALYGEDYANNREYQEAKRQLDQETMQQIVAGAQAAYQTIGQFMSAASAYSQACSDLEVAKITANYDKQIEAAGNNTKKKEKLEKERDKKIADAKTKANKKAMIMEMAQAVAQSAMGAISAYSSTMAGAPYPANLVLAPISAGIALAAGALQIATIKKQHQAEEAGYYEGGFTGGHRYRREAGVVHEGEFVANHKAVENPNILPFLTFLDQAQRNNTVGSLSAQDVSRSMGAGTSQLLAPIVNVNVDNERLNDSIDRINENQDRLASQLEQGIGVDIPIDGENGLYRRLKRYEDLLKKK
jgi:hypothetical protein